MPEPHSQMSPAPGSSEGWDKPITMDLGVLADELVSSEVGTCSGPRQKLPYLSPQCPSLSACISVSTAGGIQHDSPRSPVYDLERQQEWTSRAVGWAVMSITCLIQAFIKFTCKVTAGPI